MPINPCDVAELYCTLANEDNLRITIKESARGSLIALGTTFFGGVLLGPVGLALGGAVGGSVAAYLSYGKFKPVAEVINSMSIEQKDQLAHVTLRIMNNIDIQDLAQLALMATGDIYVRKMLVTGLITYLREEMSLDVQ